MKKFKSLSPIIYLLIYILVFSLAASVIQYRFLFTSFKVNSDGVPNYKFTSSPSPESESVIDKELKVFVRRGIFASTGYSLSFYIKTASNSKDAITFFSSYDAWICSGFSAVTLIDGKIVTSRIEHINPAITDARINDNTWHHLLISFNSNEERIYIDGKLNKSIFVDYLKTPDKYFVINPNPKSETEDPLYLKDLIFINKDLKPNQIKTYQNFFKENYLPLYSSVVFSIIKNFLSFALINFLIIFLIKYRYPKIIFLSVIKNLQLKLFLFSFSFLFLWTDYGYQILLLCFSIFSYFLLQTYKNAYPKILKNFINTLMTFFISVIGLLKRRRIKDLYRYLLVQDPETYFLIFLFLGLLFAFNRFLFTNNLFR